MSSPQSTYSTPTSSPSRQNRSAEPERMSKTSPLLRPQEARVGKYTKAWTLEEERILLQKRVERVPYKQIAVQLGKTDLACRLHYHQMVMAKRTPQTQPGRSIVFLSSEHPPEIHRLAPSSSSSPNSSSNSEPYVSSVDGVGETNDSFLVVPLPKQGHRRASSIPQQLSGPIEIRQTTPYTGSSLRQHYVGGSVDLGRLQHLYKEYAADFWQNIASAYSQEERLSGTELESAFLAANNPPPHVHQIHQSNRPSFSLPPIEPSASSYRPSHTTPRSGSSSPEHHQLSRSQHQLAHAPRCSVESLLNHASRDTLA